MSDEVLLAAVVSDKRSGICNGLLCHTADMVSQTIAKPVHDDSVLSWNFPRDIVALRVDRTTSVPLLAGSGIIFPDRRSGSQRLFQLQLLQQNQVHQQALGQLLRLPVELGRLHLLATPL